MSVYRLLPVGFDEGGRPIYDRPPLARNIAGDDVWLCPNCGAELFHAPTHDTETGSGLMAVPDTWTCWECPYSWAE